ncbi:MULTISPECIES: hypothetical protein [unclassified Streptomyces]|uniref:hypothetical protein n=1 Tax=unclassified Streptomyces TaxID=2593676 RepID=UPI002E822C60|nr:hypothetical protein [Streptomyces sp. NBC_00589]WTI37483.1 hypothetical protein OIC96_21920 [Streptomyces sp. NBC_00775]WUB28839.1 hypothetical protein OHA51_27815 [Streptomyces sp. NBC_00589]
MAEQRTLVHIETTNSQANDAREVLKLLRGDLQFQNRYSGPIETWRSAAQNAPTQLVMYLAGDVKQEVESRLAAMSPFQLQATANRRCVTDVW